MEQQWVEAVPVSREGRSQSPGFPRLGLYLALAKCGVHACSDSLWQGLAPWGRGGACPEKGHSKWLLGLEGSLSGVGDLGAFGSSKAPP